MASLKETEEIHCIVSTGQCLTDCLIRPSTFRMGRLSPERSQQFKPSNSDLDVPSDSLSP